MHSEKKGYQNGAPGVLLLQILPFFQTQVAFIENSDWGTKIVPLRVPYYRQSNSAPRGTVSVPFFFWVCFLNGSLIILEDCLWTSHNREVKDSETHRKT